jgi:hypothetical protein
MSSFYKKVTPALPVVKAYSPVALVTAHGDSWLTYNKCKLDSRTNIALRSSTHDYYDGVLMGLMEKGIIGRVD